MGRRSFLDKLKLVSFDEVKYVSTCLMCGAKFRGRMLSNIKRHYTKLHGYSFEGESVTAPKVSHELDTRLRLTKDQFLKCCIGLVTMRNIALEVFDDEYLKQLIEPYEQAFGTDLRASTMSAQIAACASNVRERLRTSFNQQPLWLKADVAKTQSGESKLLLTVHYLKEFVAQAHTIGVISLPADQLRAQITTCLADFGIDMSQIYSVVTDYSPSRWPHEKETIENEFETLHSVLAKDFGAIRCTRQIFNMAAYETFEEFHTQLIGCRTAVEKFQYALKPGNELTPPTVKDNGNYWLSTYQMIESLLNARSGITFNNINKCFNAPWRFAEKFVEAFKPMVECLKKVQPNEYIVGDFYRDWLLCEAKLEKMQNNKVAENLLASMLKWKEKLLSDQAIICALYLDPRFTYQDSPFWDERNKKLAVQRLLKTSSQINSVDQEFLSELEKALADDSSNQSTAQHEDPFQELEMKVQSISNNSALADTMLSNQNIGHLIDKLSNSQRVPFGTNILEYWKTFSVKEAKLKDLAEVVLALPTNQGAAESALDTFFEILANQSSAMTSATVQDMLMIRLNQSLFKNSCQPELFVKQT